jgi:biopolymer transport protein ExbB
MENLSGIRENLSHIAPIAITGVIAVAIIIERTKALLLTYPMTGQDKFFERVRDLVMNDRMNEAVALCDMYSQKPICKVTKEGLLRAHQPEEMIADGLQLVVSESVQKIAKRTGFLSMIANVATLLGLFGTIAGLIQSFEAVGQADAQQKSAILAAGISTAMNATMMGLAVAIPCMVAFSFLMNRSNRMSVELEQGAIRTMDILRQRQYGLTHVHGNPTNPTPHQRSA